MGNTKAIFSGKKEDDDDVGGEGGENHIDPSPRK